MHPLPRNFINGILAEHSNDAQPAIHDFENNDNEDDNEFPVQAGMTNVEAERESEENNVNERDTLFKDSILIVIKDQH